MHAVKYYNPVTHICMIRCGTEQYRQVSSNYSLLIVTSFDNICTLSGTLLQVWCALSMIGDFNGRRAMMHFLHLGGTPVDKARHLYAVHE